MAADQIDMHAASTSRKRVDLLDKSGAKSARPAGDHELHVYVHDKERGEQNRIGPREPSPSATNRCRFHRRTGKALRVEMRTAGLFFRALSATKRRALAKAPVEP
jgi:hypothetical protein